MKTLLLRFARDESGATIIEYSMIVAALGLAIVVTARSAGDSIANTFNLATETMKNAN